MQQTTLITGASRGIGYELAKLFAADGHDLVLVARNDEALTRLKQELEKKYSIKATVIPQDLSLPEASNTIFEHLQKEDIIIDILVNNAGFGNLGPFATTNLKTELQMIQVNITALTELTKLFLPGMLERKSGKIMNISSIAAFIPGPLMAIYHASKAFVLSFSTALSKELEGSGVTVTVLCPGPTATGFQQVAYSKPANPSDRSMVKVAEVALCGYTALKKGRLIALPGFRTKIVAYSSRFFPISWILNWVYNYNS